jgi:hypothetical protein
MTKYTIGTSALDATRRELALRNFLARRRI